MYIVDINNNLRIKLTINPCYMMWQSTKTQNVTVWRRFV